MYSGTDCEAAGEPKFFFLIGFKTNHVQSYKNVVYNNNNKRTTVRKQKIPTPCWKIFNNFIILSILLLSNK